MTLETTLETLLQADLSRIAHPSFNTMFTGFSRRWQCQLFAKVFASDRFGKFSTERTVNEQLNDRVLMSSQLATGEWVLVMRDLPMTPLSAELTPEVAQQMGAVLARFHRTVHLPATTNQPSMVMAKIDSLRQTPAYPQLLRLQNLYESQLPVIETELRQVKPVVLHGDVGCRNYQLVNGSLVLIDFERAHLGVPQVDFQKLFYQDFAGDQSLQQAFLNGYGALPVLSSLTSSWLTFQSAVGILSYVQRLPDPEFERVAQRMLQTVADQIL